MITLYHGGGASGFEVLTESYHPIEWESKKSHITALLSARQQFEAVNIFTSLDFCLFDAVNGFDDEFAVLYTSVPVERYVQIETEFQSRFKKDAAYLIAKTTTEICKFTRFIAVGIKSKDQVIPIENPSLPFTSETVERALQDAESLLRSNGAISAVDRIHTALHGYFKVLCEEQNISFYESANVVTLFGLIRKNHPILHELEVSDKEVTKILRGFSIIIDSLNNLRNNSSLAHPNNQLLKEPEAILVINSARVLLHYIKSKLQQ